MKTIYKIKRNTKCLILPDLNKMDEWEDYVTKSDLEFKKDWMYANTEKWIFRIAVNNYLLQFNRSDVEVIEALLSNE